MQSFRDEIRRSIFNKGFLLAVALIFLMYSIDGNQALNEYASVLSLLEMITGIGAFKWVIPCVGTLCYASSFVNEYESNYVRYHIIRGGIKRYALQKCIAVYTSAILATCIAIFTYTLYAYAVCREILDIGELGNYLPYIESFSFYNLIADGHYILYIVLHTTFHGMAAGMWALTGLFLSTIWKNAYVALFAPVIIVYFKDFVWAWLSIHPSVTLKSLEMGTLYIGGTWKPLVIIAGIFTLLSCLLAFCTCRRLRRMLNV